MRASLSHIFLLHFCFPLLYSPSFSSDVSFPLIFIYSLFFWGPGKNISRLLILERKVFFIFYFFSFPAHFISFHFIPLLLSRTSSLLCCMPSDSQAILQHALARYSTRWKVCSQSSLSKLPSAASLLSMGTLLSLPGRLRERGQGKETMEGKEWRKGY